MKICYCFGGRFAKRPYSQTNAAALSSRRRGGLVNQFGKMKVVQRYGNFLTCLVQLSYMSAKTFIYERENYHIG